MSDSKSESTSRDDWLVHYLELPRYKAIFVVSIGLFLCGFLLIFQPFGVSNYDPQFEIDLDFVGYMLGLGGAVTAALAASEFVLRPLMLPAATRGSMIGWIAWDYVLAGSVAYVYYNHLGDWHDLSVASYLGFLRDVGLVISFPVAGFLLHIRHIGLASRFVHLTATPRGEPSQELLQFTSDNGKDVLTLAAGDLLYLESQDNYLEVVYLLNGERRSQLIRSSLKRVEAMDLPGLVRCHRSFMVNLLQVRACNGNQHGLKLSLTSVDQPLPVSRGYTAAILEALGPD
ncbi:LytTR family DNA-binding domain-containing protein [Dokdonella sp.]|uniref:LytTR family DNA-binding domain-containing protein n=1 Tax=Dokdonella sp. TaxID=2291710 RepID=UPI0035281DC0